MRLDTAVELLGAMPFFDLATVVRTLEGSHQGRSSDGLSVDACVALETVDPRIACD